MIALRCTFCRQLFTIPKGEIPGHMASDNRCPNCETGRLISSRITVKEWADAENYEYDRIYEAQNDG